MDGRFPAIDAGTDYDLALLTRRVRPDELELVGAMVITTDHFTKHRGRYQGHDVFVSKLSDISNIRYFFRAAYAQQHLRHSYIIYYYGCHIDEERGEYWLVEEYYESDLKTVLEMKRDADSFGLAAGQVRCMRQEPTLRYNQMHRVLAALVYLASQGFIHRAISPTAIYLTSAGQLKLGGLRLPLRANVDRSANAFGEVPYLAFELLHSEEGVALPYTEKSDVYAFAVVLNEFLALERPFLELLDLPELLAARAENPALSPALFVEHGCVATAGVGAQIRRQLTLCFSQHADVRPTFRELRDQLPDLTAI